MSRRTCVSFNSSTTCCSNHREVNQNNMNTGDETTTTTTPVQRTRNPHKPAAKSTGRDKGQDSLQKKAADRITATQEENAARDKRLLISSKLQTADHVGKHPAEPHKHREVEHRKVGLPGTGVAGENDEEIEVETVDQEVDGQHVDTIVVNPPPPGGQIGGNHPLTEGQRVQQVIDEHNDK